MSKGNPFKKHHDDLRASQEERFASYAEQVAERSSQIIDPVEDPKVVKARREAIKEGKIGINTPKYKYDTSMWGKLLPKNYSGRMNRA